MFIIFRIIDKKVFIHILKQEDKEEFLKWLVDMDKRDKLSEYIWNGME